MNSYSSIRVFASTTGTLLPNSVDLPQKNRTTNIHCFTVYLNLNKYQPSRVIFIFEFIFQKENQCLTLDLPGSVFTVDIGQ